MSDDDDDDVRGQDRLQVIVELDYERQSEREKKERRIFIIRDGQSDDGPRTDQWGVRRYNFSSLLYLDYARILRLDNVGTACDGRIFFINFFFFFE